MNEIEKSIGTKEVSKLSAISVVIKSVTVEPPKEGSKAKIVSFTCLHPEREETIELSAINIKKAIGNNINIKKETLWYNEDEDGNIRKSSAVAQLMNFYNKKTLKEFCDSTVNTDFDSAGYLVIKAY